MTTQILGVAFQYSHTVGRYEFFGSGFQEPVAMARSDGDLMYVVSRSFECRPVGKRVTMCTVGEEYIGDFGRGVTAQGVAEGSSADGSLMWPTSIALDKDRNVYVSDEWLNRISIFTKDGQWVGKWGTPGEGDGEINRPSGISFDSDDNLYLVDTLNHRIQKFTKEGKFLDKWGTAGDGDGQFNMPWGIKVDSLGNVYVADWRNDRIQKFSSDGQFLMKFGGSGTEDGQFHRPSGVSVDKDGIIYVTDWGNNRVQVFGADGTFITKMTGEGTLSKWGTDKVNANAEMWKEREIAQGMEREKLFFGPIAVDVDDEGRVFIVEPSRHRIQVFRKQRPVFQGGRL